MTGVQTCALPICFPVTIGLRLYGGVVRWGGDFRGRADEMHFELCAGGGRVGIKNYAEVDDFEYCGKDVFEAW